MATAASSSHALRLAAIRNLMCQSKFLPGSSVSGLVLTNTDAHQSEYIATCDKRVQFISGFSGSNALCVMTTAPAASANHGEPSSPTALPKKPREAEALLWTDGRYYEQAARELDLKHWKIMKLEPDQISPAKWIAEELAPAKNGCFLTDARTLSVATYREWQQTYFDKVNPPKDEKASTNQETGNSSAELTKQELFPLKLLTGSRNLVDQIWDAETGRDPKRAPSSVFVHPLRYAGASCKEKLEKLKSTLASQTDKADFFVATALDDITWFLNLRCQGDIPYCPVFFAYLVIPLSENSGNGARLYADFAKTSETENVMLHLKDSGVNLYPYDHFESDIPTIFAGAKVWVDPQTTNMAVYNAILQASPNSPLLKSSPIAKMKAVKNDAELKGMIEAQAHDSVVLCCYFSWLEEQAKLGWPELENRAPTEYQVAEKLEYFRHELFGDIYRGPSFTTISAIGNNGAVIHYQPSETDSASLDSGSIYLCDSGAQYTAGTTDVTRTMHIGNSEPTEHEKRCYTHVLKGHIALSRVVFPETILPHSLDLLARGSLWQDGLDYLHGTGHGVGAYGLVHEFPPLISSRAPSAATGSRGGPLEPGMIVTNEPGYYEIQASEDGESKRKKVEQGGFGIRLENMMIVESASTPFNFNKKKFLKFKTITLCPYQRKLIATELLNQDEIKWLNEYSREINNSMTEIMKNFDMSDPKKRSELDRAMSWMARETMPF